MGIQFSLYRRTVCILNSHFAAHAENVARRNEDWLRIYHKMKFGKNISSGFGTIGGAARFAKGELFLFVFVT